MKNINQPQSQRPVSNLAVGLGIIFGPAIGAGFGLATGMNIAASAGIGVGIGIVLGSIISSGSKKIKVKA